MEVTQDVRETEIEVRKELGKEADEKRLIDMVREHRVLSGRKMVKIVKERE